VGKAEKRRREPAPSGGRAGCFLCSPSSSASSARRSSSPHMPPDLTPTALLLPLLWPVVGIEEGEDGEGRAAATRTKGARSG
jgi:hypothetical protein